VTDDDLLKEEFLQSIALLAENAHGCKELKDVAAFCSNRLNKVKKKLPERAAFFENIICRDPIHFEKVKDIIWKDPSVQEQNQFPFLQGDIVQTTVVSTLGNPLSVQELDLWLVLTPSCDIVRREYIQVTPLFEVKVSNADQTSTEKKILDSFALGLKFVSSRLFAYPKKLHEDPIVLGYVADLSTSPSYIMKKNTGFAVQKASLTLEGWHLLNAVLKENETRANIEEEIKIRSQCELSSQ
jgi:hypothetical protein